MPKYVRPQELPEAVYESPWMTITQYNNGKLYGVHVHDNLAEYRMDPDTLIELGLAITGLDIPEQTPHNVQAQQTAKQQPTTETED